MSKEKYKLIQFRVSEKDQVLTDLINSLEEEAQGRRGFVAERLRDMIKAFHLLSEMTGEKDPYKIMVKLAQGAPRPEEAPAPPPPKEEKKKKPVNSKALLAGLQGMIK